MTAHRFFTHALAQAPRPTEVTTSRAPVYQRVLDELVPGDCHVVEQYANNFVEVDRGRLKARLRPMRGLKRAHASAIVVGGHAFVKNLHRGHYELAVDVPRRDCVPAAFLELTAMI